MNISLRPDATSLRYLTAATLYVALAGVLLAIIWIPLSTLNDRRTTVRAAETMLAQLEGRSPLASKDRALFGAESPFLEGPTVTVAGAALLQRVGGAITQVGGNVLSSQVDLEKADSKDGWIGLTVSCDLEQAALQKLLYDLEAGMPFLFIDQLVVQAPLQQVEKSRMKVLLTVSGQWWSRK
jgi:general secretion pathway protein M